ncbi:MAG: deoxyribodipyrimidine photo-lyase [Pseudomonadales bacterium]
MNASVDRTSIMWFRQDLRVADNPALRKANAAGKLLPIYILDDENAGNWKMGAASRVWLHDSLRKLNQSLGGHLRFFAGDAREIIKALIGQCDTAEVHWNRCYEPWRIARDAQIKKHLQSAGAEAYSHNGTLLWEPWTISKKDGTPYKVFSPFYKKGCLGASEPRQPVARPPRFSYSKVSALPGECSLDELALQPEIRWDESIRRAWRVGEMAAQELLETFVEDNLHQYKKGRDFPAIRATSRLSPHLHFGEISPQQVWHRVAREEAHRGSDDLQHFRSELGWREFSYYLLYHWPTLPDKPFNPVYKNFPWRNAKRELSRWQRGQTGYPIIDAGMRELWETGYMHNRVRMITGSFLVKNQLLHWRHGEAWFWDCLVDADLASNSASWQWVAGCGADAAPYFRIFNPVLQSEKFDPQGEYIKRYCPELEGLQGKALHQPWLASQPELDAAGIELGKDYPLPILDLKASRDEALAAYRSLKG